MSAKVYPPNPIFRSSGERAVFDALLPQLSDEDVVFANLEISDVEAGDVEIDLAVLLKDHGLVVVEVKGAHITHNGYSWIQSDPSGSREINPAGQARRNMHVLRDLIQRKWSLGLLRSEWVVAFPHCDISDPHDPVLPIEKIIQERHLNHSLSTMKSVANKQRQIALPSFDGWIEVAVKNLIPLASREADREGVLGNNYEFVRGLTHERELILRQLEDNNRYYVKGPAGSGKTWLAFEQAKRWAADGLRVGIVAYNTGLITYMEKKNSELPLDKQIPWIGEFHTFAEFIGSDAGEPNHYSDEVDRYRDDLIAKAKALEPEYKFDAFVVDEAQDFLPSWWETLKLCLKDPAYGRLALFGDDQQQVFGHRPPPDGFFANLRLTENLRNSQQIAKAVSTFIERPTIAKGPHAFEIEYVISKPEEEIFEVADDVVANLTDKEFWHPGEIALLTTKSRHPEHKRSVDADKDSHWESLWANEDVFYCTVGGFKGLERAVVVLAIDGFHSPSEKKDVLYVGMSRARDKLVVVAPEETITELRQLVGQGS